MACMLFSHRAFAADMPEAFKKDPFAPAGLAPVRDDKYCAPYAYKERDDIGCGGADKCVHCSFPAQRLH